MTGVLKLTPVGLAPTLTRFIYKALNMHMEKKQP